MQQAALSESPTLTFHAGIFKGRWPMTISQISPYTDKTYNTGGWRDNTDPSAMKLIKIQRVKVNYWAQIQNVCEGSLALKQA